MGLVVFVILVLALGGAGYWYFMIYKQDAAPAKTPRPTPGTSAVVKPPVRVAARLAAAAPASTEIKAPTAGVIETIGLAGDEVAEGAVVAQYKGVAAVERSLSRPRRKLMEYSEALEQAKAGGNAKLVDMYQKKVDEKAKLVEEGEAQLDRLLVLSPVAGKVEPVVDAGATVAEGAVIARVVGGPGLQATLPAGSRKLAVGDACELASAKNPGVKAVCKVSAVAGGQVTAWIAGDAGFAAGDEVVLQ
jgi:predicted deacylase